MVSPNIMLAPRWAILALWATCFRIVQPLVCKMVTRLLWELKTYKSAENHKTYLNWKSMQNKMINKKNILKTWPRGYKTGDQSQTQNKAQWLAACGHVSASSQSLRFSCRNFARPAGMHYYNHCVSSSFSKHSFWHQIMISIRSP